MNATDPRFVMPLFRAALRAGTHYLDMNLEVAGYDFAPTFSIWTTIEECLNPVVALELIDSGAWSGAGVLALVSGLS